MATRRRAAFIVTLMLAAGPAWRAAAQGMVQPTVGGAPSLPVAVHADDPNDPRVQEYARRQKTRVQIEKELFKLRADYFRGIRNTEIRQAGIAKLRKYDNPVLYPSLLKIFAKEGMDVRGAILDMLADAKNDEADTTLTWSAIFDGSKEFRDAAAQRLLRRLKDAGVPSTRIKTVIAEALKTGTDEEMGIAAGLCGTLKLYEAIPMLISAQLGPTGNVGGGGGGGGNDTSLAWILIGTQTAYVSGLQPVVGDSAVGFDPTVSVITEGTVLRVIDAVVVTYRYEVHNALVDLSTQAWGQPTKRFGFDIPKWRQWYTEEFVPYMAAKRAAEEPAQDESGKPK